MESKRLQIIMDRMREEKKFPVIEQLKEVAPTPEEMKQLYYDVKKAGTGEGPLMRDLENNKMKMLLEMVPEETRKNVIEGQIRKALGIEDQWN